jgi:alanine dehydrogenase
MTMRIGVPKEIKNHEYRVALTPAGAAALRGRGHTVLVQSSAGGHAGFADDAYVAAGATIVASAAEAWDADLVMKVKEPQPAELGFFRRDQVLFTYLHLVTCPDVVEAMRAAGSVGIAYETVTNSAGGLPLLIPMSEVAGRLAIQVGAWALMLPQGGSGVCLPGVPGVPPGIVTILGAGTVGTQAARTAMGFGADVTILDVNLDRLRALDDLYGPRLKTCYSEPQAIARHIAASDLVIGAVLVRGRHAPQLITREMLRAMRRGSVLVDVGIDQGGCAETSRQTTHADPIYVEEGVVHYCVGNMPGAVARTSTLALTQATLPYALALADLGWREAARRDAGLLQGLQVWNGSITYAPLADDLGLPCVPPENAITG